MNGSRADSLGYGSRSSSLQRTHGISSDWRARLDRIAGSDRNIRYVQPIVQSENPTVQRFGNGGGVCAGVVREWIIQHSRNPSQTASHGFGDTLNNNMQSICAAQAQISNNRSQWSMLSSSDNAHRVESQSYEAGGLPFVNESPVILGSTSPRGYAQAILDRMPADGFYAISMHAQGGGGHVIGVQLSRASGEFKLVDANTGEFSTNNMASFARLLESNIDEMTYAQQLGFRCSVRQYQPLPALFGMMPSAPRIRVPLERWE